MLNDTPNAFVINHNIIVLTSGLLKYIQSPEALIGVIAHEIGHIKNFHLTKRKKRIEDMKLLDQISSLATITTSILSNNPEIFIQSTITSKSQIQNFFSSYSKNQEREADLFTIQKLNDLKISSEGLIEFLLSLEKESNKNNMSKDDFMFATHPSYDDRLDIISNFSNDQYINLDNQFYERFLFIKAKLFGYTENEIEILENYLQGDSYDYGQSIILANRGSLLKSLKIINNLIDKKLDNAYFLETKADILFNHGFTVEAKKFYKISLSKNINNTHIRKRLFYINYENLTFSNHKNVSKVFQKYSDLVFSYSNDINFYHKWLNIFEILNKEYWILYVTARIDIMSKDKKNAILKLKTIIDSSKNTKLIINANKLINKINVT